MTLRSAQTQPGCAVTAKHAPVLDALLAESGFSTRVRGDCMQPFIEDRSLVKVEPGSRLKCGDIMIWRDRHGQLVCHRYLGKFPGRNGAGAVSWADSSIRPDGLVPFSRVLGKVSQVDGEPLKVDLVSRIKAGTRYVQYGTIRVLRKLQRITRES